jgi:hypothetical protein
MLATLRWGEAYGAGSLISNRGLRECKVMNQ